MAAAGTALIAGADDIPGSDGGMERTIKECVLEPIPGPKPAGNDVRNLAQWVVLDAERKKAIRGTPPATREWEKYGDLLEDALCTKSKDLELGVSLTEARTRTHGFAGTRDGFWMLCGLIEKFAGQGLFPEVIDEDLETQFGQLYWLNEKFPNVLRELELTRRPEPPNYSLNYLIEANAPHGGMITKAEWDEAAMAGKAAEYEDLVKMIEGAKTELSRLKQAVEKYYGAGRVAFGEIEETLATCKRVVDGFLNRLKGGEDGNTTDKLIGGGSTLVLRNKDIESQGAWGECADLARSGQIDQALSKMMSLAAAEPNGRVRFQRKLLLADLCLQTNRKKLGKSILEELDEIIEKHKLVEWETTEIVGGVWARLVRCYRDKAAGTADETHEAEFYNKLSRLDPWQALACGEPVRKD
jgi:hypothetical protein